jgi:hypothetical protein
LWQAYHLAIQKFPYKLPSTFLKKRRVEVQIPAPKKWSILDGVPIGTKPKPKPKLKMLSNESIEEAPQVRDVGNFNVYSGLHVDGTGRRILTDITRGRETIPIPCINDLDNEPFPTNFMYTSTHVLNGASAETINKVE